MVFIRVENFFSRFKKMETREERDKKLFEILKAKIVSTRFKAAIRGTTLHLYDISPALRSEIFLRKKEILEYITSALKDSTPSDISFLKP